MLLNEIAWCPSDDFFITVYFSDPYLVLIGEQCC